MDNYEIFHEIFIHGITDVIKTIPILFLTYLLMELVEHKFANIQGKFAQLSNPLCGSVLGAIPLCGLSSIASNLFSGGLITIGTAIAVFVSTSDEMLPVLLSSSFSASLIIKLVAYKVIVAAFVGVCVDFIYRFSNRKSYLNIGNICDESDCHCDNSILKSAIRHTATTTIFILIITLVINALTFWFGEEVIATALREHSMASYVISSAVGLIPNCAISVVLATMYADGIISTGVMLAGLFSSAGVGLIVLFRINKNITDKIVIVATLLAAGIVFGIMADTTFISTLMN